MYRFSERFERVVSIRGNSIDSPRKVEGPCQSRRAEARPARAHTILSILVLLWSWGTTGLVALNDIDFFSMEDLLDTSHPHHEHIVVVLVLGGILAAAIISLWGRHRHE